MKYNFARPSASDGRHHLNKAVHVEGLPFATPTNPPQDLCVKKPSPPLARGDDPDRFDWEKDADCIILHEQPATAVYVGKGGHIVIRQTNGYEDDVTILIAPENATVFQEGLAEYLRRK
jgi:hypothetical protein